MIGKGFGVSVVDVVDVEDDVATGDCDCGCDWDALLFDDEDDGWGEFGDGVFMMFDEFAPFNIPAGNSVTFDSFKFGWNPFTNSFGTLNGLTELLLAYKWM